MTDPVPPLVVEMHDNRTRLVAVVLAGQVATVLDSWFPTATAEARGLIGGLDECAESGD